MKNRLPIRVLLALVLLLSSALALGNERMVEPSRTDARLAIGRWMEVARSPVAAPAPPEQEWQANEQDVVNLGFSLSANWLRLRFSVPVSEPKTQWILNLGSANVGLATVWHRIDGELVQAYEAGTLRPFRSRAIPSRELAFPLAMDTGEHEVLVRVESNTVIYLVPSLSPRIAYFQAAGDENLMLGVLMGLLAVMALYNFCVYGIAGERVFLFFSLSLMGGLWWRLADTGLALQYVYPEGSQWQDFFLRYGLAVFLGGLILVTREFFHVETWSPRLARTMLVLTGLLLGVFLFPVFRHASWLAFALVDAALVLCVWVVFVAWFHGKSGATAFGLGLLSFIGGISVVSLRHQGLDIDPVMSQHALELASISAAFLGSVGLAGRLMDERDLSRRAQDEVASKSFFLANMSHEIRTPLNAIVGFADLMRGTSLQPEQRGYVERIQVASNHLLGIINDILGFSKIEAGQVTLETVPVDVRRLLDDIAALYSDKAHQAGVTLEVCCDANLRPGYLGDPLRLNQVLHNLVSNALKFTSSGSITLSVDNMGELRDGDRLLGDLVFRVADTGIGIAPEEAKSLFKPFSQADASTTRRFGGTGLGLAICKQIVDLMGGTIRLDSEAGRGSTFSFTVPVVVDETVPTAGVESPLTLASASPAAEGVQAEGLRVLVVEDNATNQVLLRTMLGKSGVACRIANHGEEALSLLEQESFDAVFMDCQMPVMDGYATTRAMRRDSRWRRIPIIAMTANALADDREQCLDAGMNDYVSKPIRLADVVKALRTWAPHGHIAATAQEYVNRQTTST
ncbi:MAG: response regulator [Pseudomonadales bacterium]|nr:response regulator [Pseudomonadales bacterium]